MEDGRTRIKFDKGEEHRYKSSSMHKMRAEGESESGGGEGGSGGGGGGGEPGGEGGKGGTARWPQSAQSSPSRQRS